MTKDAPILTEQLPLMMISMLSCFDFFFFLRFHAAQLPGEGAERDGDHRPERTTQVQGGEPEQL